MGGRNLTGYPTAAAQPLHSSSSRRNHQIGEYMVTADGRGFRYALNGAAALVVGDVLQSRVEEAKHDALAVAAAAIGATEVTVTTESTTGALDENEYADGWMVIDTTPGLGYTYPISGHPAADASSTCVITLAMPIEVALTTDSRVTLVFNPWSKVIQSPGTTLTGCPVGVAIYPITAAEYGWVQTHGPCGVLISGTPGAGLPVGVPHTVAGAVIIDDADATTTVVGRMIETGRDATVGPVFLTID